MQLSCFIDIIIPFFRNYFRIYLGFAVFETPRTSQYDFYATWKKLLFKFSVNVAILLKFITFLINGMFVIENIILLSSELSMRKLNLFVIRFYILRQVIFLINENNNQIIKQNILLINFFMLTFKKSKTQKSPHHSILLYKSAQLKELPSSKNRRDARSHDSNGDSIKGNSLCVKKRDKDGYEIFKTNRKTQKSIGNSTCDYNKGTKTAKKKSTNDTFEDSQLKNSQYKIQDLLGFSNSISKKQSMNSSRQELILSEIKNNKETVCHNSEFKKIKSQNEQLMRVNEHLLYQKQYFRQKTILQEVQIRDLSRKLNQLNHQTIPKKSHYKNKSCSQDSDLSFKFKGEESKKRKKNDFYLLKDRKVKNSQIFTEKSSLLISQSDEQRYPQNKENCDFTVPTASSFIRKTQNQFAQLLQSVQNQNNQNRKLTLRKMLAIKAMELKKIKNLKQ